MSDPAETVYQAPMADGMTYRIMRGYSVQQINMRTVIVDHLGKHWHEFDGIVPIETAHACITAYKAGVKAGRAQADADAGGLRETLKDLASRAHAALAKTQRQS
jgi:hypothetical protein